MLPRQAAGSSTNGSRSSSVSAEGDGSASPTQTASASACACAFASQFSYADDPGEAVERRLDRRARIGDRNRAEQNGVLERRHPNQPVDRPHPAGSRQREDPLRRERLDREPAGLPAEPRDRPRGLDQARLQPAVRAVELGDRLAARGRRAGSARGRRRAAARRGAALALHSSSAESPSARRGTRTGCRGSGRRRRRARPRARRAHPARPPAGARAARGRRSRRCRCRRSHARAA